MNFLICPKINLETLLKGMILIAGAGLVYLLPSVSPILFIGLFGFLVFIIYIIKKPIRVLWLSILLGFISSGLARYIPGPWGLAIDIVLFLGVAVTFIIGLNSKEQKIVFGKDILILSSIWFAYLLLEILNPNAKSMQAWFYAMRGIGFYQLMSFYIALRWVRNRSEVSFFIHFILFLSIAGSLWGLKQNIIGTDFAENHWLYAENHHEEHILHGVLRVFSFYSDAGQFGANQAMISLVAGILFLYAPNWRLRIWYLVVTVLTFVGFAISGTRGALIIPATGGIAFLFLNRNYSLLFGGFAAMGLVFYILKYTFFLQGVEQVRRMRTALDPENRSLQVRIENQRIFGSYLKDKPMGGGVGSAGYWGARFSPDTLLANTATDSWYVKIWAETGVIGILLHIFILGYIVGKGVTIIGTLQDPRLRNEMIALMSGIIGVLFSSYGNQVFGQMPTGMIMNMAIPIVILAKKWDVVNTKSIER